MTRTPINLSRTRCRPRVSIPPVTPWSRAAGDSASTMITPHEIVQPQPELEDRPPCYDGGQPGGADGRLRRAAVIAETPKQAGLIRATD